MTPPRHRHLVIFDASPLSSFALATRLDLLEGRFGGSAVWTVEVRNEISKGVRAHVELRDLLTAPWLGEPLRLDALEDVVRIEELRFRLGGNARSIEKHRGESATIVAAQKAGAISAIDDIDARRLAQALGVPVISTLGILRACCRDGELSWDDGWGIYQTMLQAGRRLPELTQSQFEEN